MTASLIWEIIEEFSSPSTLEARLADVDSTHLEAVDEEGRRLFGIRSRSGGNDFVVEGIEDSFNFVRMVLWLPTASAVG